MDEERKIIYMIPSCTRLEASSTSATMKWYKNWGTMTDLPTQTKRFLVNHLSIHATTMKMEGPECADNNQGCRNPSNK